MLDIMDIINNINWDIFHHYSPYLYGNFVPSKKALSNVYAYLGLSLGTKCPAPLTDANVKFFNDHTMPPTWSSCLCNPLTHHYLQGYIITNPCYSLKWLSHQRVPVIGTSASTSPE